ncbi:hypothetical protein LTA6_000988 [Microbacterium sp. LTA6]|uniref:hypothetical protein n=1 Tax=Microbacterium sp. LTA6 TaxID=3129771 RepID=UPI00324EA753
MSNAAEELHTLFSSWRQRVAEQPGVTMSAVLAPADEGIEEIRRAFALIEILSGQLRFLASRNYRVAVHQRHLRVWARVPLMLQFGWGTQVSHPDHVLAEAALDQLESLSSFLDDKVLAFDDSRIPSLRSLMDQADVLLTGDTEMDSALMSYLRRLIAEIRYALDDDVAGRTFDYTAAVERLRVAFQAAAEASTSERKRGWRGLVQQIFVGVTSGGLVEGGAALAAITIG